MTLHWMDWLVIAVYGVLMIAVAAWAMRGIRDVGGFLLGRRRIGKLLMLAGSFASGVSANHPVGVAAATFKEGWSGLWLSLTWILVTPFYWMYPPLYRRLRIVTMVDFVQLRYGRFMAQIVKWSGIVTGPIVMGLGVKAGAIVVEVMTGGRISGNVAIGVILLPTVVYTIMGGIIAAMATDLLQGLMIIVLSVIVIPCALHAGGGLPSVAAGIDDSVTGLFRHGAGQGFGFWWIAWFLAGNLFSAAATSGIAGAAAKNEMAARFLALGGVIKRLCTVGWGVIGLMGIALVSGLARADDVFPVMSGLYLPAALRGLMVASILAAVMSTADIFFVGWAGLLVQNIYREHLVRHASPAHYLAVTRFGVILIGLCTGWVATTKLNLVDFMTIVDPLGSLTGVAILAAIMWRRSTKWGAIASVLVMTPLYIIGSRCRLEHGLDSVPWGCRQACEWMLSAYAAIDCHPTVVADASALLPLELRTPLYLLPGLAALVVGSLLTRQHRPRDVAEFYARLDTPVGEEQSLRDRGFKVDDLEGLDKAELTVDPADHDLSRRYLLTDLLYLPWLLASGRARLSDYTWDWIGLAGSAVFIVGLIRVAMWVGHLF